MAHVAPAHLSRQNVVWVRAESQVGYQASLFMRISRGSRATALQVSRAEAKARRSDGNTIGSATGPGTVEVSALGYVRPRSILCARRAVVKSAVPTPFALPSEESERSSTTCLLTSGPPLASGVG